ncbi:CAP domain-containing protein [Paenibacillus gansuensis]|uniref:CAP domain-containing protein n=1 Tax=Paenibacillus gansuensis TaxID=306542 RepID=A0ABW5PBA0_9BACL
MKLLDLKKMALTGVIALTPVLGAGAAFAETGTPAVQTYQVKVNSNLYTVAVNPQMLHPDLVWPGFIVKLPQLQQPVVQQPVKPQPIPQKPAVPQPAPQKPVPQKPPVQKPVEQPAVQQPTAPKPVPQQPVASADSSYVKEVVSLVNQERAKAGLKPVAFDTALSKMAHDKAVDMYNKNYFDHNSPTYGSPFDMMNSYGIKYSTAGENIAKGQQSPQQVMNDWMNSPGHRANILNGSFTKIGVGYYQGEWVQEFIG